MEGTIQKEKKNWTAKESKGYKKTEGSNKTARSCPKEESEIDRDKVEENAETLECTKLEIDLAPSPEY